MYYHIEKKNIQHETICDVKKSNELFVLFDGLNWLITIISISLYFFLSFF